MHSPGVIYRLGYLLVDCVRLAGGLDRVGTVIARLWCVLVNNASLLELIIIVSALGVFFIGRPV